MMSQGSARSAGTTSPTLSVSADLRIDVAGHRAHLVGDGQSLVLHLDRPLRLLSVARDSSVPNGARGVRGPRQLGRAADALRSAGLTLDVRGPHGRLLSMGAGPATSRNLAGQGAGVTRSSGFGRMITGSNAVQFSSATELTRSVIAPVPAQRLRLGGAAFFVVLGSVWVWRRSRR